MTQSARRQPSNERQWWRRTTGLAATALLLLAVFGFVVHAFVDQLDRLVFAGFPLGYYMAAQGSVVAFVVLVFWFVSRQERLDRRAGVAEPEPRDTEDLL